MSAQILRGNHPHQRPFGPPMPFRLALRVAAILWTLERHRRQYQVVKR